MTVSGLLVLDKPIGMSSNTALVRAKRLLGVKKAGHTGSLDPLATGVLPLCFGEATKLSGQLLDADKAYTVTVKLGITTASGDAEGEVTATQTVPALSPDLLERVLDGFRGPQMQVPPMYSALKQQGKRLYELARKGIEVDRPARKITIHQLELLKYSIDELELEVHCSKGTYIRSLAEDIGKALGCGAHVKALRRIKSAGFGLEVAITLDSLEALPPEARNKYLLPADCMVQHWPKATLAPDMKSPFLQGQPVTAWVEASGGDMRTYDANGAFIGIAVLLEDGRIRARRILHQNTGHETCDQTG